MHAWSKRSMGCILIAVFRTTPLVVAHVMISNAIMGVEISPFYGYSRYSNNTLAVDIGMQLCIDVPPVFQIPVLGVSSIVKA